MASTPQAVINWKDNEASSSKLETSVLLGAHHQLSAADKQQLDA